MPSVVCFKSVRFFSSFGSDLVVPFIRYLSSGFSLKFTVQIFAYLE